MPFRDRQHAGEQLAAALQPFRQDHPVIIALPRGGVPVAAPIARALGAPLGLLIVRKLGVPRQPELAMGAIVDGDTPQILRNEAVMAMARVSEADFAAAVARETAEIDRRRRRYGASTTLPALAGRTIILVDDGIATGATIRVALRALRSRQPRRLIVAVPVAARDMLATLQAEADQLVCLESHDDFGAVGQYYEDFAQVQDAEVLSALAAATPAA
jgi:predicted phosphoribosyltransferase